jgi:hypothetical protein
VRRNDVALARRGPVRPIADDVAPLLLDLADLARRVAVANRHHQDVLGMLVQLGAVPAPA